MDRLRGSVVLRLFVVVFAFSCIVTVALTAVQLYREYRHGVALLQGRLSEVDRIYSGSLSEALWRLDRSELTLELEGMLRLDGISAVQVREDGADPMIVSAGHLVGASAAIAHDFPIMREVQGAQRSIGILHVEATLDDLYRSLARTAALILVNQAANTFLVALFITWLLNRLVMRHLVAIARAVARYDYRELPTPLTLHRRSGGVPDELDHVVSAINAMASRVHGAYLDELDAAVEREARHAAEAANGAKSAFLASMSHELRTPLNGILGYAQILRRDGSLGDTQREAVAVMLRCGEQLLALIHEVLDFAMIEAGRMRVEITDVPLAATVSAIKEVIVMKAAEKGLRFVCKIEPDVPVGVRADERRLRQVLLNLLTNAVKFTGRGTVELCVRRSASGGAGFEVRDTGCGVDTDELERIFLPFEQGRRKTSRDGGMGLGLAISRQFVRAMGGDIAADSEVGRGSVFRFDLPPAIETSEFALARDSVRIATAYEGPRRTALVIDDVEVNRAIVSDWLRSLGFAVIAAQDAAESFVALTRSDVSLVLTDIVMPGIDGLEFIRHVRALPEFHGIPIIALSASSSATDVGKTLAAGANAFLPKPLDFNRLETEIAALLGIKWIYSLQRHEQTPDLAQLANVVLPTPPAESMHELHQLARMGDMRGVRDWADVLNAGDSRYEPFASAVRTFARTYQSKALLAFVERHLHAGGVA
ncbi:ATP-binding protein [Trinickia acidisoli]|uniref:ATP-binding protein n=1 Tax=Trinickia acidisoli TaxID=2767482 RepID=UPI001F5D2456|nr:ATP-binding protein [Trinickia acidisoli]